MTNPEISPLVPCNMSKEALKLLEFLTVVQKLNAELPIYYSLGWAECDKPLPFKIYPWEIKALVYNFNSTSKHGEVELVHIPSGITVSHGKHHFTWRNTNCCIDLLKQALRKRYEKDN